MKRFYKRGEKATFPNITAPIIFGAPTKVKMRVIRKFDNKKTKPLKRVLTLRPIAYSFAAVYVLIKSKDNIKVNDLEMFGKGNRYGISFSAKKYRRKVSQKTAFSMFEFRKFKRTHVRTKVIFGV